MTAGETLRQQSLKLEAGL